MLVRLPGQVLPAEVPGEVRQRRVDLLVGLVPTLVTGHRSPPLGLACLLRDAGDGLVEEPGDPVDDGVLATAAATAKLVVARELAVAGRAAEKRAAGRRGDDAHVRSVVPRASRSSACSRSTCAWRSSTSRRVAALNDRWS